MRDQWPCGGVRGASRNEEVIGPRDIGLATYIIDVRALAGVNGRVVGVGYQLAHTCVAWDLAELLVNVGCSVLTPLRWDDTIAIVTINNPVHLNAHSRPSSFITPPRSVRDPLPVAQPTQGRRVGKKSLVNSPRETLIGISPRTSQMSISDPDFLTGLARPRTISANSTALLLSSVQRRRFNSLSMSHNPCSLPLRLNATCVSLGAANVAFSNSRSAPYRRSNACFLQVRVLKQALKIVDLAVWHVHGIKPPAPFRSHLTFHCVNND